MDTPPIQYVKTIDGVSIAYAVAGQGQPIVWMRNMFQSHLQLEWEQPIQRAGFENIIRMGGMLIRYDPRGSGLSERDVDDISPIAHARDLEAVLDKLQIESTWVLAIEWGAAPAIVYATEHPERVSRLVLLNPATFTGQTARGVAWKRLSDDWELMTETVAGLAFGFGYAESSKYAAYMRAAIDHKTFLKHSEDAFDLVSLARDLRVPTHVIRHTGITWLTMSSTRDLVEAIPDCTMTVIEGTYITHGRETASAIADAFVPGLSEMLTARPRTAAAAAEPSAFRTVLFTDLVGHTEMMQRLGDERGRDVLREHERITREILKAHGGTEIKTDGDSFMVSFGSVTKAVECAVALQRAFDAREGEPLHVRIGLNAGEPIEEAGDLFGATVILASRIAAKAGGGEILVADTVRGLCSGKGFLFSDRGEFVAKGIGEPVRISEVNWRSE